MTHATLHFLESVAVHESTHSTATNLLGITNFVTKRKRQEIDIIYVDFSKAFAPANHTIFLSKVAALNIRLSPPTSRRASCFDRHCLLLLSSSKVGSACVNGWRYFGHSADLLGVKRLSNHHLVYEAIAVSAKLLDISHRLRCSEQSLKGEL